MSDDVMKYWAQFGLDDSEWLAGATRMAISFDAIMVAAQISFGYIQQGYDATVGKSLAFADSLKHTSDATGVSLSNLQRLKSAGTATGVTFDEITTTLRMYTQRVSDSGAAGESLRASLASIGVSVKDSNGAWKDGAQLMMETNAALNAMPNAFERANLAKDIYGRSWYTIAPMIRDATEAANAFKNADPISDKAIEDAHAYGIKLDTINAKWSRMGVVIGNEAIPVLSSATDAFSSFFDAEIKKADDLDSRLGDIRSYLLNPNGGLSQYSTMKSTISRYEKEQNQKTKGDQAPADASDPWGLSAKGTSGSSTFNAKLAVSQGLDLGTALQLYNAGKMTFEQYNAVGEEVVRIADDQKKVTDETAKTAKELRDNTLSLKMEQSSHDKIVEQLKNTNLTLIERQDLQNSLEASNNRILDLTEKTASAAQTANVAWNQFTNGMINYDAKQAITSADGASAYDATTDGWKGGSYGDNIDWAAYHQADYSNYKSHASTGTTWEEQVRAALATAEGQSSPYVEQIRALAKEAGTLDEYTRQNSWQYIDKIKALVELDKSWKGITGNITIENHIAGTDLSKEEITAATLAAINEALGKAAAMGGYS